MPSPALAGILAKQATEFTSDFAILRAPYYQMAIPVPESLPLFGKSRDTFFRATPYYDGMWANAVNIAIAQILTRAWEVTGNIPFKVKQGQEILSESEGQEGFSGFLSKLLQDYLLTENGCFIEIERVSKSPTAKIKALWALDSLSCYRTNSTEYPVVFYDIEGGRHALAAHQVLSLSDSPSPEQRMYNAGMCAASRAYREIYKNATITRYYTEKISGQRPLAIHFLKGITTKQLEDALGSAKANQNSKGVAAFMGALVVALLGQEKPEVTTIDFASLPDNFDRKTETHISNVVFAGALGFSPDELEPQTGQALGVGAQSQVQKDREKSKGLEVFVSRLTQLLQRRVMPSRAEFHFITRDFDEKLKEAAWKLAEVNALVPLLNTQVATGQEVRNLLVEEKVLPDSMRVETQEEQEYSISDDESNNTLDGEEAPTALPSNVEDLTATKATLQTGDRGGKFYLDDEGNKIYGDPPKADKPSLNSDEQEVLGFIPQGDFKPNATGKKTVDGLIAKGLVVETNGKYSLTDAGKAAIGKPVAPAPATAPAQPKNEAATPAPTNQDATIAKITEMLKKLVGTPNQTAAAPTAPKAYGQAVAQPTTPTKARLQAGKLATQNPQNRYRIQPTGNGKAVVMQGRANQPAMPTKGASSNPSLRGSTTTAKPSARPTRQQDGAAMDKAKGELNVIANKIRDTDKDGVNLKAEITDLKGKLANTSNARLKDPISRARIRAIADYLRSEIKARVAKQTENKQNKAELKKQQTAWSEALNRASAKEVSKGLELVMMEYGKSRELLGDLKNA